jgi:hypothetical protein
LCTDSDVGSSLEGCTNSLFFSGQNKHGMRKEILRLTFGVE